MWMSKWNNWKSLWEDTRQTQGQQWSEWMKGWETWKSLLKQEWVNGWQAEWHQTWNAGWAAKWQQWDEWMGNWTSEWRQINLKEIKEIPEFIMPSFNERMKENFNNLWNRYMNAPVMAQCWAVPASQLGLKNALGLSLNRTLQWIYNTTDVYIKSFNLTIETATKTVYTDGNYMISGLYSLATSFDLYGVVINNASGTYIRSQFRYLNVTDKIDGGKFGFHGWIFTPSKTLFMDLTAFSIPLEEWNSTYSTATNTTTFALTKNINVTTPFGNVIIDPEMNLVVPGHAIGFGDAIAIASVLPSDLISLQLVTATAIVSTVVIIGYYLRRRGITVPIQIQLPRNAP
jgi:hypothetical protein